MPEIKLTNVTKRWGKFYGVDQLNMTIEDNAFVTLLGPSGCGKTTTLRMIAGLETPTSGRITIGDQVVFDSELGINVPANKRRVGFLFQNYALWPNMTVYENIAFGLSNIKEPRKLTKEEIDQRVKAVAQVVKISMFLDRYPAELSGGQQQRVAIARTLAPEPTVLFMDEPLSNLDAKLRLEMRYELQRLHVETGSTFVYVTHDQMEAMTLATKICLMNNGVLQQYEPPLNVYHRPENLFVADFVGNPSINFVETRGQQQEDGTLRLSLFDGHTALFTPSKPLSMDNWYLDRDTKLQELEKQEASRAIEKSNKDEPFRCQFPKISSEELTDSPLSVSDRGNYVLGIRPEFVHITENTGLNGEIYGAMPTGMESTIKIRIDSYLITGVVFGSTLFNIGTHINVDFTGCNLMLFDQSSGRYITSGSLAITD